MTQVTLPNLSRTKANANLFSDVVENDEVLKKVVNSELDNENLSGSAGITRANLASESKPFTWYTPKIIATEESRENVAFGTLTTPDEIKAVVLPTNGLIAIFYVARFRSTAEAAGSAALFIGENQLKAGAGMGGVNEPSTIGTNTYHILYTDGLSGLQAGATESAEAFPSTGFAGGWLMPIFAAAGTYNISVKFKASSGKVTAKERKLWCAVLGY